MSQTSTDWKSVLQHYRYRLWEDSWSGRINQNGPARSRDYKHVSPEDYAKDKSVVTVFWTEDGQKSAIREAAIHDVPESVVKACCEHHAYEMCIKFEHNDVVIFGPLHNETSMTISKGMYTKSKSDAPHVTISAGDWTKGTPPGDRRPMKRIHLYLRRDPNVKLPTLGPGRYEYLNCTSWSVYAIDPKKFNPDGKPAFSARHDLSKPPYHGYVEALAPGSRATTTAPQSPGNPPPLTSPNSYAALQGRTRDSSSSSEENEEEQTERPDEWNDASLDPGVTEETRQKGKGKEKAEQSTKPDPKAREEESAEQSTQPRGKGQRKGEQPTQRQGASSTAETKTNTRGKIKTGKTAWDEDVTWHSDEE